MRGTIRRLRRVLRWHVRTKYGQMRSELMFWWQHRIPNYHFELLDGVHDPNLLYPDPSGKLHGRSCRTPSFKSLMTRPDRARGCSACGLCLAPYVNLPVLRNGKSQTWHFYRNHRRRQAPKPIQPGYSTKRFPVSIGDIELRFRRHRVDCGPGILRHGYSMACTGSAYLSSSVLVHLAVLSQNFEGALEPNFRGSKLTSTLFRISNFNTSRLDRSRQ